MNPTMRVMQQVIRINEIQRRAERIGLSLKQLCDAAGVRPSTVYRWLGGGTDPRLGNYASACERLETELHRREQELLDHLERLHPRSGGSGA